MILELLRFQNCTKPLQESASKFCKRYDNYYMLDDFFKNLKMDFNGMPFFF